MGRSVGSAVTCSPARNDFHTLFLLAVLALVTGRGAVAQEDISHVCSNPQTPYDYLICQAKLYVEQTRRPSTSFQDVMCTMEGMVYSGDLAWCKVVAEELGSELYTQIMDASQEQDVSPKDILYQAISRCDNSICDSGCSFGAIEVYVQQLAELHATSSEPFRRAVYGFCFSAPSEMGLSFEKCYQGFGHGLAALETLVVEQALEVCSGWLEEDVPNAVAAEACKDGALQQFVQQHSRLLNLGMVPTDVSAEAAEEADKAVVRELCGRFAPPSAATVGTFEYDKQSRCAFHTGAAVAELTRMNLTKSAGLCAVYDIPLTNFRCRTGATAAMQALRIRERNPTLFSATCAPPPAPPPPPVDMWPPFPRAPFPPGTPRTRCGGPGGLYPTPHGDGGELIGTCVYIGASSQAQQAAVRQLPFCGAEVQYPVLDNGCGFLDQRDRDLREHFMRIAEKVRFDLAGFALVAEGGEDPLSATCQASLRKAFCEASFPICDVESASYSSTVDNNTATTTFVVVPGSHKGYTSCAIQTDPTPTDQVDICRAPSDPPDQVVVCGLAPAALCLRVSGCTQLAAIATTDPDDAAYKCGAAYAQGFSGDKAGAADGGTMAPGDACFAQRADGSYTTFATFAAGAFATYVGNTLRPSLPMAIPSEVQVVGPEGEVDSLGLESNNQTDGEAKAESASPERAPSGSLLDREIGATETSPGNGVNIPVDGGGGNNSYDTMITGLIVGGAVLPAALMGGAGTFLWRQRKLKERARRAKKDQYHREVKQRTEEILSGTYAEDRRAIIEFHEMHGAKKILQEDASSGQRSPRSPPASSEKKPTHVLNPLHTQSIPVPSNAIDMRTINNGHDDSVVVFDSALNPLASPPPREGGGSCLPSMAPAFNADQAV